MSAPVQSGPGAYPASCIMGTGSFPGVKSGRGVNMTAHPLLVPWSWKSRAIPLLPLWALRPVQSLSAGTRVHFTFTFSRNQAKWQAPNRNPTRTRSLTLNSRHSLSFGIAGTTQLSQKVGRGLKSRIYVISSGSQGTKQHSWLHHR
jgi:hypothetical protein